jgi:hypothetical protein
VPQAVASFIVPERNTAFMTNLPPEKVTVIDGRESMEEKVNVNSAKAHGFGPPHAPKWFKTEGELARSMSKGKC